MDNLWITYENQSCQTITLWLKKSGKIEKCCSYWPEFVSCFPWSQPSFARWRRGRPHLLQEIQQRYESKMLRIGHPMIFWFILLNAWKTLQKIVIERSISRSYSSLQVVIWGVVTAHYPSFLVASGKYALLDLQLLVQTPPWVCLFWSRDHLDTMWSHHFSGEFL